ncbi:MAG TPA: prepilin-type N-terminal cleavage/methylation domain-containing protein [Candidatus Methylomirabilis sp.]
MRTQRFARRPPAPRGFTMLEALVASTIFLIVMGAVYLVYEVGAANYSRGTRKWDVQSQARVVLERLSREVRTAGYASPNKLTDPVVIATNDTLSIHADVDGTGPKYITYSRRDCSGNIGTTLYRNASTTTFCGGQPFIEDVADLSFAYYELSNVPVPYPPGSTYQLDNQGPVTGTDIPTTPIVGGSRDRIRQVKIALTVRQQVRGVTIPFTATTDIALRNLIP